MRMMTLSRSLWYRDAHSLQQFRRHWHDFHDQVRWADGGYELRNPALFEEQVAVAMRMGTRDHVRRAGREGREGAAGARSVANRARAGAQRAACICFVRRPALHLSGVRIAGGTADSEEHIARQPQEMVAVVRNQRMPIFRNGGDAALVLDAEAARWTPQWDCSAMEPPTIRDVAEVLRRARRSAPGPDGIP